MKNLVFQFSLIIAVSSVCLAQNIELSMEETASFDSLSNTTGFFARVIENKSYCCQVWTNGEFSGLPSFDVITMAEGTLDFISDRGEVSPYIGAGNAPEAARKCFVASPNNGFNNSFITLGITSGASLIPNANVRCSETTLYGGFNTVVTDFNFIEVTNTLIDTEKDEVIRFRITARGTIAGVTILDQIIDINPSQRIDIDVHSTAGNDFGPVVITHNGPPGSLRAVNAQYRIITASPLNFEPVLSVPFREGLK
jgi:hypothetical protein